MSQTYYPAQDWTELEAKDIVRVIEPGRAAYRATIDTKTPDSSVVWVITATGYRRAFDAREGVLIIAPSTKTETTTPLISSGTRKA
ncbi:hypothetical protein RI444_01750 [Paenarthrobacter sp. AT5]|uniref:hypothetical protein n=1 Tax=Paenarthrobacter TaxID=1742992 RepID=UPI001A993677|nr:MULTISPECIES: hypothetical protein [Paenarthrobacter]QSZ51870.1 hypothetical protein AYX19_01850 [Paenarthrobacter ureafaciens]WOC61412.1 hypothetical protein RI444_01750 [Paenarthrobacter sp. AT5]